MTSDQLALISIFIAAGAALCAAISVLISARQTQLLARSIKELSTQTAELNKQTRISSTLSATAHYQNVDSKIIEDPDLLALLPYSKSEVFAAMLLNGYSARHRLLEAHVIGKEEWDHDLSSFKETLSRPFVQSAWEKLKHSYSEGFQEAVDSNLKEMGNEG